jgi:hypothetical protein
MAETYSATALRADLYRLLDRVLATGVPIDVERRGRRIRIAPVDSGSRLERLQPLPGLVAGDPEELVHLDWSDEWHP